MTNWMLLNDGGAATFDGGGVHFLGMGKTQLLVDFGRALGGINRAAGRFSWTVAQHSLLVAELLPPGLKLEGLLHDAHEAISGDIPLPFARWLPEETRKVIEQAKAIIQKEFEDRIGYVPPTPEVGSIHDFVRRADGLAFLLEVEFNLGGSAAQARDELGLSVEQVEVPDEIGEFIRNWQGANRETVAWQWASEVKTELEERRVTLQAK